MEININGKPENLLNKCTKDELEGLGQILDVKECTPGNLEAWFCNYGSGMIQSRNYKGIVLLVAKKLKVVEFEHLDVVDVERKIVQKVMNNIWEDLSEEKKIKLEVALTEATDKYGKNNELVKVGGMGALLGVAHLSGFGVYLMATTALGGITSAIGLTLPFVIYTGMTQVISIIIGPIGWAGLGIYAILNLFGPDYKKIIPGILYISALRWEVSKREERN